MPTPRNVTFFETAADLRAWFEANHASATELWVGYHRKRTGRPSVSWQDVVDQELCFGWIDSVRYSLGDDSSAQRITPRRKGSVWSAINIKRFEELEEMSLVHPSGRAAFAKRDESRSRIYSYENRSRGFDAATAAAFRKRKAAWKFFEAKPQSSRTTTELWILSEKITAYRHRTIALLPPHATQWSRLPLL